MVAQRAWRLGEVVDKGGMVLAGATGAGGAAAAELLDRAVGRRIEPRGAAGLVAAGVELLGIIGVQRGGRLVRKRVGADHEVGRDRLRAQRRRRALVERRLLERDLGPLVAFQQRVALELFLDKGGDLEIGELEQLDGLTQLRRHHQRLRVSELQPWSECHEVGLYNEKRSPR